MGRPRRLSLGAVMDAAVEIGLENLSLSAVAARLGVGISTIYTYVQNRDELVRLAAARLAWRPHPEDVGQHWSEIVRTYVDGIFTLFATNPDLLGQIISGAVDPEDEIEELENFLGLLTRRGFTAQEAFGLYRSTVQIGFGAAVGSAMMVKWRAHGGGRKAMLVSALAAADPGEWPLLRSLGEVYIDEATWTSYEEGLSLLLEQTATRRGEKLPAAGGSALRSRGRKR